MFLARLIGFRLRGWLRRGLGCREGYIKSKRIILELGCSEAKDFFLKGESYCNFDLPPYIVFDALLKSIYSKINGKKLSDFYLNEAKPKDYTNLNHTIFNNKNGKYAWRPLQLTHPALYVSLVYEMTKENNWKIIVERCREFVGNNPNIECMSYPVESLTRRKDRAEQISSWWQKIEQRSIEFALDYEYLIQTDISDCYSSIYTHSIAWALHGKDEAKKDKENKSLLGNVIDRHMQDMHNGQTNGIPQGSVLMDFVAEIVLGYVDFELSKKINDKNFSYHILRYRDDYRIFVNNPQEGELIVKILTETLIEFGLKLSPSKTVISNNIVKDSIKADKLFWIDQRPRRYHLQKYLLSIQNLSRQFPNSGSLTTALSYYYKKISNIVKEGEILPLPLISIITDIAYHNPKSYPISSAILSKFIGMIKNEDQKKNVIKKIINRFAQIPNTGHMEIWLQRITITFDKTCRYDELICHVVDGDEIELWNSADWLSESMASIIKSSQIVDRQKIQNLDPVILNSEVDLFMLRIFDYS